MCRGINVETMTPLQSSSDGNFTIEPGPEHVGADSEEEIASHGFFHNMSTPRPWRYFHHIVLLLLSIVVNFPFLPLSPAESPIKRVLLWPGLQISFYQFINRL